MGCASGRCAIAACKGSWQERQEELRALGAQGHCGGGSLQGTQEVLRERQSARGDLSSRSSRLAEACQALPVADGLRLTRDQ